MKRLVSRHDARPRRSGIVDAMGSRARLAVSFVTLATLTVSASCATERDAFA